ncbi:hypothetical protein MMC25_004793 [Agyrium rufum]|nr:hypothetical protein [Agyrium rufum]
MANERKQWVVTEPYLHIKCGLGEGPFYEKSTHHLRFTDIVNRKLHTIDLNKGPSSLRTLELENSVGITADIEGSDEDEIAVGAKYGYATLKRSTGELKYLKKIWDREDEREKAHRMRFNDGAVDTSGRFWAGSMNDPLVAKITNEGALYRLDPDMTLHRMVEPVAIPNGIGWSEDDKHMFFTDSPTREIAKYDYDRSTGSISNRQVFWRLEEGPDDAAPDGWAMDVSGCIWTAVFGLGKVLRLSPEGKVIGEIILPTRCITCPTFVGEELFITSASEEDPENHPESLKYQGSLFRVHVGIGGRPKNKFPPLR